MALRDAITEGIEHAERLADASEEIKQLCWPGLSTLTNFLDQSTHTTEKVIRDVFMKYLEVVNSEAMELQEVTPPTSHIVFEHRINAAAAKSQLVKFVNRDLLNNKVLSVYTMLDKIGYLHKNWCLSPPITEDQQIKDSVDTIESIWTSARKAVTTIAALGLVYDKKSKQRQDDAQFILGSKKGDLAKSLVNELEAIVSGAR
eukprot:3651801-Pyramimonas_sp.AAC.1